MRTCQRLLLMGKWKDITFLDLLVEPVRNGIYKKKEFHGRGVKIVNMGELFKYPRLNSVNMKRVEITEKEKEKVLLSEGDLIFARRSLTAEGAGKCSIVKEITENTTFESSIIRARINLEKAFPDFLYYYFNSPYGKYLLGTILRQVAVSGITGSDLMQLVLNIPEAEEQKEIAEVLSSLDDKIDLLHCQNKTLEALAQTLFRQYFVEEDKDGWEEKPLSEIANFLNGLACQKFPPENDIDKLPVLKIKDLKAGISDSSDWATTDVKPEYTIESGDVIFAWSASLIVKIWDGEKCILNQHLFKVTSENYPKWFCYQWCKYHLDRFIAIAQAHATTMGHIKRKDLDNAMCLIPSDNELETMSEQFVPLMGKMADNSRQIKTLENMRDTLLPKLMREDIMLKYGKYEGQDD